MEQTVEVQRAWGSGDDHHGGAGDANGFLAGEIIRIDADDGACTLVNLTGPEEDPFLL
jgi:hypothetical protein